MAKPLHQRTPGADIKQVKGKKIAPHRPQKDCGPTARLEKALKEASPTASAKMENTP